MDIGHVPNCSSSLQSDIRNALEAELQTSLRTSILHILGLLSAFILLAFSYVGVGLTLLLLAFHLVMLSVHSERQCSLKAIIQDHFGLRDDRT